MRARRYWRALGFSDAEPGEAPYTDTDVVALQCAVDLVEHGGIEERYVLALTRAMGQTMARLADWQVDIAVDRLQSEGRPLDAERARARLVGEPARPRAPARPRLATAPARGGRARPRRRAGRAGGGRR